MDDTLFSFDEVSVTPDGAAILTDISVRLPPGGISVIVGPSGAGKTTLLRLCNRLSVPSTGQVLYRGWPLPDLDPLELRRKVGMVFQRPVMFGGSIEDNLVVAAPDATEEQLTEVLRRVHLSDLSPTRPVDDLSGGEAQRLCLARTLLTGPETLLMDEPTASIDPTLREGLEQEVLGLAREGTSVVWVTHDPSQMHRLGTHVVALEKGRVTYEGPPADFEPRTSNFEVPHD